MTLQTYLESLNKRYQSGISKEHAYRVDLENLLRNLLPHVEITNEPANVTECGNPDFVLTQGKLPLYFERA